MAGSRELTIRILGDASSARRTLNEVDDATTRSESRWKKYGGAIAAVGAGAAVALGKFGADSVAAFNESRKVGAQTEAVIKSTGGAANVTAEEVGDLAGKLQKLSGVEDEAIQSGQNMLLTFTNLRNEAGEGNDVFNQATATMLDMSVALGTDAKSSAVQLGKAMNDPIAGISALSRVGVTFTDEQKSTIKTMVEMGDTAGAQKVILAELNKEFGGSAKAAGDAQSPMERLSLRFGDLQEKVGAKLVPVLEKLTEIGLGVIDFIENLDPGVVAVIATIAALAAGAFVVVKAVQAWTAVQAALNVVMSLNPFVLVAAAVAALVAGIVIAYQKSETFRDIVDGVFRAVSGVVMGFRDAAVTSFNAITGALDTIISTVRGMPGKISSAASGMWDGIKNAFRSAINWIIRAWNSLEFKIPGFDPPGPGPTFPGFIIGVPNIPQLAHGGIVRARPGGTLALIGEGGQDEAVIPLPRGGGVAAPVPAPIKIDVHVAGSVVSESDLVDSVYQGLLKLRRRNGGLGLA